MRWAARLRRIHRLATLVVGAQLLVWAFTGFAFSWFDFAAVRGTNDRAPATALDLSRARLSPAQAVAATRHAGAVVTVELVSRLNRIAYVVSFRDGTTLVVDAATGDLLAPVDAAQASAIAVASFRRPVHAREAATVASVADLDGPAIRVRLDDEGRTEVFVSPTTGQIVGWRNRTWRAFDWLWSLHVLGYVNRDNPAHAAMRVVASLALLAMLSGAALWLATRRRMRNRPDL